jgi:hypothetical protein
MKTSIEFINRAIKALDRLEEKKCHSIFFEYENGLFRVKILHKRTEQLVFDTTFDIQNQNEQQKFDVFFDRVENMSACIWVTTFLCYKREFILGEKSGKWEKTIPVIEFGDNATHSTLIDGSGYYIDHTRFAGRYLGRNKNPRS